MKPRLPRKLARIRSVQGVLRVAIQAALSGSPAWRSDIAHGLVAAGPERARHRGQQREAFAFVPFGQYWHVGFRDVQFDRALDFLPAVKRSIDVREAPLRAWK